MDNVTGRKKKYQVGRDKKLVGDNGYSVGRYATNAEDKRTFVFAESCDNANGRNRSLKKPVQAWSKGKYRSICNMRLAGLKRLIEGRHHGFVDTDDGDAYFAAALPHLVAKVWAYPAASAVATI